jgi:hypothetical protein
MLRTRTTVAAVVLALAGCSTSPSNMDDDVEPAVGPVPVILASAGLRLPVEDYLPTADQADRLSRAQVALVRACLARFGFSYDVVPVPSGAYGPASLTDRRYGITDARLAAQFGYGLGPRDPKLLPRPDKPDIGADGENVLSGQGRSVVDGQTVPPGGCIGEAGRALTSSLTPAADLRRGSDLQLDSFARSRVDSRVRSVFQAWSACMGRSGYAYADPLSAVGDPAFIGSVDQHQRAVAAADIGCKVATNLVGVWFTVEAAYQSRVIATNRAAFAATRSAIEARDQLAAAALAR